MSCPASRSCLAVNEHALISAAGKHKQSGTCWGKETEGEGRSDKKYRFSTNNDWEPEQKDANTIEMKLTADMLTTMGFLSLQLGNQSLPQPEQRKPDNKKYYVGISGGGWRALSGHIGAFRALSTRSALSEVDMFSSVSGGTWFLTKLAFDNDFAGKVLLC